MKASLLLLFVLFFSIVQVSAQWVRTGGPEGTGDVNCITKVGNSIWAGTNSGIYTTSNEGLNWSKLPVLNNTNVQSIYALGDTIILLYDTLINNTWSYTIRSLDGGNSWDPPVYMPENSDYESHFTKVQNTLLVQLQFTQYISNDFGQTWSELQIAPDVIYRTLFNDSIGVATVVNYDVDRMLLYISTDGLNTWQCLDTTRYYYRDIFLNDDVLLILDSSQIFRSVNNGISFDTVLSITVPYTSGGLIEHEQDIYAIIGSGSNTKYKSNDNGLTWELVSSTPTFLFNDQIPLTNGNILTIKDNDPAIYNSNTNTYTPSINGIAGQNIYALNSNQGRLFASTFKNLYTSEDAGLTWHATEAKLKQVTDLIFKGDTVIALSPDSLFRSFDNGITWQKFTGVGTSIAIQNSRLYASGGTGNKYSDNWGNSWQNLPNLPMPDWYDENSGVMAVFNHTLFIVTNAGKIFKLSINLTWDSVTTFYSTGAHTGNTLYVVDSLLVLNWQNGLVSTNDGVSWHTSPLNGIPLITDDIWGTTEIAFIPSNIFLYQNMWVAYGGSYGIYKSTDYGTSWQPLDANTTPFLTQAGFCSLNNILYTGTYYNSVWRRAAPFTNITGHVYFDINNNSVKDTAEYGVSQIVAYTATSGHTASTNSSGDYNLYTDAVGDTLRVITSSPYVNINPSYYITAASDTARDFGIYIHPSIIDLSVDVTNVGPFRPGFGNSLTLRVNNNAAEVQSASVQLVLDNSLSYISASPPPTTIIGDTLKWSLGIHTFMQQTLITINVNTDVTAQLGDSIRCYSIVSTMANDTLPSNDTSVLTSEIVGSYDPNDKQSSIGTTITPQQIENGEEITFTIRFQNTGNYTADFVRIDDTLNRFFDLSTFRILSSSHTMYWTMEGQGIVNFHFDSIMLPSSSDDESGSHGFVKYSLRCKQSASIGDAITNTAFIYFDFNTPIVTNTTTSIVSPVFIAVGIEEAEFPAYTQTNTLRVFPNPTSDKLSIDLSSYNTTANSVDIYNSVGMMLKSYTTDDAFYKVTVNDLSSGLYLCTVKNKDGATLGNAKFIIQH